MTCDMILLSLLFAFNIGNNAVCGRDGSRYFNPNNYVQNLPSLSLGYISELPIPSMKLSSNILKPTKVAKTKVINIVTKYVYKSPVCVKLSGKKSLCQQSKNAPTNLEYTITKEYNVKDDNSMSNRENIIDKHKYETIDYDMGYYVESSEDPRPFSRHFKTPTPTLSKSEINDLLIEDRLDQLETILPHYTRRRVYETSTLTVTKVRSDNRLTATLLVKNCVPRGYPLCPPKVRSRKSKVAQWTNNTNEDFFG